MINDSEISYLETQVRRLRSDLADKKNAPVSDEVNAVIAALETELKKKEQDLRDLQNRKRSDDDLKRRDTEQKRLDDRRKGIS